MASEPGRSQVPGSCGKHEAADRSGVDRWSDVSEIGAQARTASAKAGCAAFARGVFVRHLDETICYHESCVRRNVRDTGGAMRGLPQELVRAEPAVVRPRDLTDQWAQPRKELHDLAQQGAVLRLAHGYYAVVPEAARGRQWIPSAEAAGLAIAQVDYGQDHAAAMGPSAARLLRHIPRALGAATIATSKQRPPLETVAGRVQFVTRAVGSLDLQRTETELGQGWVTTPEQTLVDLVDRPGLGGLGEADVLDAVVSLADVADLDLALDLAAAQRKRRVRERLMAARAGEDWRTAVVGA